MKVADHPRNQPWQWGEGDRLGGAAGWWGGGRNFLFLEFDHTWKEQHQTIFKPQKGISWEVTRIAHGAGRLLAGASNQNVSQSFKNEDVCGTGSWKTDFLRIVWISSSVLMYNQQK